MAKIAGALKQRFPTALGVTAPTPAKSCLIVLHHDTGGGYTGEYYDAMVDGDCHNDGTTDDLAHLQSAAAAALSESKALYLPGGDGYKLSGVWTPPAGLTIFGDGTDDTHVKGPINFRNAQSWSDMMIGDKTVTAVHPYYTTGTWTHQDVSFTNCKFRGGGSGNQTLHHTTGYTNHALHILDLTFLDCEFECNYTSSFSRNAQDIQWFIRREYGDISDNIVFENCHFGALNEQGRTGGTMGGHEWWSSWSEDIQASIGDKENGYFDNIYFTRCIWERSDCWNLDISGYQYCPSDYTENTVYITDCVFKGLSGAYHPEYTTRVTAQIEPSMDAVISRNIFGIGDTNAFKIIKGSHRVTFTDNVFDYRTFAYDTSDPGGGSQIDSIYGINQIIRCGTDIGNVTIRDNTLLLPTGKYTGITQQGWIMDPSSLCTKTGNSVSWGSGNGPIAAYE